MELALLLLPLLALAGLRYVPEDTALTVHRFGRYARTLSPGLRFTVPVLDRIAHRVRLVGHQVEIPVRGESSARAAVYYQILEPQRAGNALDHVDTLVEQHAIEALSSLAATEGEDSAELIAARLKRELNEVLAALGLRVTRCNLHPNAAA